MTRAATGCTNKQYNLIHLTLTSSLLLLRVQTNLKDGFINEGSRISLTVSDFQGKLHKPLEAIVLWFSKDSCLSQVKRDLLHQLTFEAIELHP